MLVRRPRPRNWKPICSTSFTVSTCRALATSTQLEVTDPLLYYRGLVAQGKVKYDPEQMRALVQMRKLHSILLDYQPPIRLLTLLESLRPSSDPLASVSIPEWPFKRSQLSAIGTELQPNEVSERQEILGLSEQAKSKALVAVLKGEQSLESLDTPKGFLLTGPPGTGKSMLLDIFFHSLPVPHKVRFHYHHFLLSIYSKVHAALEEQRLLSEAEERAMNEAAGLGEEGYPWSRREEMQALAITKGWRAVFAGGRSPNDPDLNTKEFVLVGIARDLIKTHGWLLAFDEVQLVDIAGAGLINRVLSWYWRLGGVVIGTSNRVPEDLYNSGVQRDTVASFLTALSVRSPVIEILSPLDYRREQRGLALSSSTDLPPGEFGTEDAWKRWGSRARGWFVKGEEKEFKEAIDWIVGSAQGEKRELKVYGRTLTVPWACDGVARFTFHDLCEMALGPADYITIASNFHTVIITDVPVLLLNAKNEARRLITLLDSLYETKTRLLVLAAAQVDDLFFPDAVNLPASSTPETAELSDELTPPTLMAPQDIVTSRPFETLDESSLPSHSALRAAVDPAGEIGDSLTEEMMGDVLQDLEAPYRPNISSYDATSNATAYERDEARKTIVDAPPMQGSRRKYEQPHPSASTPSFQSLAIFTGEEERFAFRRAVSRVHEMSSAEFLCTASWTPLDIAFRTWEKPSLTSPLPASPAADARHSMGSTSPLGDDKISGVLPPQELRLKYPSGLPTVGREVEVKREREIREKEGVVRSKRGVKVDLTAIAEDPRAVVDPPIVKPDHVWGVREDWGKGAGKWGKGATVHEADADLKK